MQIFGLEPILVTLIICIVGISLRIYTGKIKSNIPFNIKAAGLSCIIGVLISVGLVAPVVYAMPDSVDPLIILPLLAGQIILVMKAESIGTTVQSILKKKKDNVQSTTETDKSGTLPKDSV